MAEGKKSIIVYADWIDKFEELTDDEAGKLIKHFFRYVNDLNPEFPDRVTRLSFIDIEKSLKRDLVKWENEKKGRSDAGKKGMAKRWGEKITNDNTVINSITKITDNATVNVNDTATTISREKLLEFLRGAAPISISMSQLGVEADKIIKQYGGKKIGNMKALCNRWIENYQTAPVIEMPVKTEEQIRKDKMQKAL